MQVRLTKHEKIRRDVETQYEFNTFVMDIKHLESSIK